MNKEDYILKILMLLGLRYSIDNNFNWFYDEVKCFSFGKIKFFYEYIKSNRDPDHLFYIWINYCVFFGENIRTPSSELKNYLDEFNLLLNKIDCLNSEKYISNKICPIIKNNYDNRESVTWYKSPEKKDSFFKFPKINNLSIKFLLAVFIKIEVITNKDSYYSLLIGSLYKNKKISLDHEYELIKNW